MQSNLVTVTFNSSPKMEVRKTQYLGPRRMYAGPPPEVLRRSISDSCGSGPMVRTPHDHFWNSGSQQTFPVHRFGRSNSESDAKHVMTFDEAVNGQMLAKCLTESSIRGKNGSRNESPFIPRKYSYQTSHMGWGASSNSVHMLRPRTVTSRSSSSGDDTDIGSNQLLTAGEFSNNNTKKILNENTDGLKVKPSNENLRKIQQQGGNRKELHLDLGGPSGNLLQQVLSEDSVFDSNLAYSQPKREEYQRSTSMNDGRTQRFWEAKEKFQPPRHCSLDHCFFVPQDFDSDPEFPTSLLSSPLMLRKNDESNQSSTNRFSDENNPDLVSIAKIGESLAIEVTNSDHIPFVRSRPGSNQKSMPNKQTLSKLPAAEKVTSVETGKSNDILTARLNQQDNFNVRATECDSASPEKKGEASAASGIEPADKLDKMHENPKGKSQEKNNVHVEKMPKTPHSTSVFGRLFSLRRKNKDDNHKNKEEEEMPKTALKASNSSKSQSPRSDITVRFSDISCESDEIWFDNVTSLESNGVINKESSFQEVLRVTLPKDDRRRSGPPVKRKPLYKRSWSDPYKNKENMTFDGSLVRTGSEKVRKLSRKPRQRGGSARGICSLCGFTVGRERAYIKGRLFHESCIYCSKCERPLNAKGYIESVDSTGCQYKRRCLCSPTCISSREPAFTHHFIF
ncbi:uncharacterized protein LOC117109376 [Anneissia japonica]|uniref:uncharacterized protein LOC117109376 n=1 Tax=Anneissia japonica TaxID=1529436 RepID=UPI001425AA38|nr:uncharacterized protein LOC117109376 [Anneissia japonica]